jgi:hypothetical protein
MGNVWNPNIVTEDLQLCLDAGNVRSYPGSGSTWFDLSSNGYNFTVNASAYSTSGGIPHMNFEGSYGAAKRVVSGSLVDVPNAYNGTVMVFSTILNSTSTWRTLMRGASSDHQVIVEAGSNRLGMYDNNNAGFLYSGVDVTSIPNTYTSFNCLTWKFYQTSPYYSFQWNASGTEYTITDANATFNNGFCVIGAYHDGSTAVGTSSQYWGKISLFLYYNVHLTQAQITQNYNAFKNRFGV